jgi:hypothetical protein
MNYVVHDLPEEQRRRRRPALERIAQNPTPDEIEEGTGDTAQEVLDSIEAGVDITKG